MKYTLLDLTQSVLSSMDSDEINSINDTVESQQVVEIIKTVYDDIISRGDLTTNKTLFNLAPSADLTKPTLMYKPQNIDKIHWLKYDCRLNGETAPAWAEMSYLPTETFIEFTHSYNPDETDVDTFNILVDGFVLTFTYKNNTAPKYYTTFNDNTVLFDAYDSAIDSTLQSIKSLGYGTKATEFVKTDEFVPNLQPQQFALLLNEAKSLAWVELKQTQHAKAEQSARRNWIHLQKTRKNVPSDSKFSNAGGSFDRLPNFARRV